MSDLLTSVGVAGGAFLTLCGVLAMTVKISRKVDRVLTLSDCEPPLLDRLADLAERVTELTGGIDARDQRSREEALATARELGRLRGLVERNSGDLDAAHNALRRVTDRVAALERIAGSLVA